MWRKYRGALIPIEPPHLQDIDSREVRKELLKQKAFLARWVSDWDCGKVTEWWYCIRDEKIYLDRLSSKQRYRINRGYKNCELFKLSSLDENILNEIYECALDAYSDYPVKYRPVLVKKNFIDGVKKNFSQGDFWISRDKDTGIVSGYAYCIPMLNMVDLSVVKTRPAYQKKEVNAVLAYKICEYYLNERNFLYICDGSRNIAHETNYQDFLVRNIGFRYAYCKLHIVYRPVVKLIVNILYPFRNVLSFFSGNKYIYNICCILKQEKFARSFKS